MLRNKIPERTNWQGIVESQGFPFHSAGVRPDDGIRTNWYEGAYYAFTSDQVDVLEAATEELHARCLDAVEHICKTPALLAKLGIPDAYHSFVIDSWRRKDPTVYGRFDFAYDGKGPPKMLEYNADTPTTAIETAVVQWNWLNDVFPKKNRPDQFCSLHEKLIARWKDLGSRLVGGAPLYFTAVKDNVEEFATVEYLRDTTEQAGLPTRFVYLEDIRWDFDGKYFVDPKGNRIQYLFKLYPWEYMFREEFGKYLPATASKTGFVEPPWKAVLSNKGILPILWELFPDHPNLLPAYWEQDRRLGDEWIAKPTLGREGGNMLLRAGELSMETGGDYGHEPKVYQKYFRLPQFDGQFAIIGSWVVGDKSAGMCVREDDTPIILNSSRVVPHVFL